MEQYIRITCPQCGKVDLVKNGHSKTGAYRYQCRNCGKTLQPDYSYNACLPAVKEQIERLTLNSIGVRDAALNPGISKNTDISELNGNSFAGESEFHVKCRCRDTAYC